MLDYVKRTFPKARYVDASDMVDRIKAIKSEEEIALMRQTALMQDGAMQAVFDAIRPGMTDLQAAAVAEHYGHSHGSEQGLFLCASGPMGSAAFFGNRHLQNRVIQKGDSFTLLVENSGAGGYYTELGRTCVLGKASQEMKDEFAFTVEAQKFTLSLLKPGASCKDAFETYNEYMRAHGKPEEKRLHCHGQGYDMVERPLLRADETMPLAKNMVLSAHPSYTLSGTYAWVCDAFLIGDTGFVKKLHRLPRQIFNRG